MRLVPKVILLEIPLVFSCCLLVLLNYLHYGHYAHYGHQVEILLASSVSLCWKNPHSFAYFEKTSCAHIASENITDLQKITNYQEDIKFLLDILFFEVCLNHFLFKLYSYNCCIFMLLLFCPQTFGQKFP